MRVSSVATSRWGALLVVLALALSILVLRAEPASAAVSAVTSTTTSVVAPNATTTLAGLAVSMGAADEALVNVATTRGTLTVNTGTGVTLAQGYSASGQELAFSGKGSEVNAALAALKLTTSTSDTRSSATVSITARNYDGYIYSAETGHFYEYVPASGITWTDAETAAEARSYGGQAGYLATVPSAGINSLITSKIPGALNVWLGGQGFTSTDGGRVWKWVKGPRAGDIFSRCTTTTGACDFVASSSFYYSWKTNEPNNNLNNEEYIVTNYGSADGLWNDLKNDNSSAVAGYVVEYGNLRYGASAFSGIYEASSTVAIAGVPDAPTSVSTSAGEGQATVSFDPPANNGGSAIDAYRVTRNPGAVQTECSSPCTITGLTPAQSYSFTVQAQNEYGWSGASSAASATPGVRPGTPAGVPALLIVGASPLAPVTAEGYPSPTYAVTSGALPAGVTLNSSSGALGGSPTTTGVFSFEVTATNTYGTAAATFSGDIESIPTIATSSLGMLRWNTAYDAMLSASAVPTATWSVADGMLPAGLTLGSNGRLHGTPTTVGPYSVEIIATNANGSDAVTYTGDVDPIPATAPAITSVTPDDESLTFQFTAPSSTGGAAVTGYEYSIDGETTWLPGPDGVIASPMTIASLANGTDYSVQLRAVTAAGGGAASAAADGTPRTVPDPPTSVTAAPGEYQATVTFSAPASNGGNPIDKYRVTSDTGPVETECSSPCVISGLTVGQSYSFTVTAHNAAGWSEASSAASATPGVRPGTPTGMPTLLIVGASPSATVTASGYPSPVFSATDLPAGVTLDSVTGALGGSPTTTGVFVVEVTADNIHGSASYTFMGSVESIPTIATSSLGTLRWSTDYDTTLTASAVPTATWSVTGGTLPAGLTLEPDGRLHGTPSTVAGYSVEITAANDNGSDAFTYTGNVDPIPATAPTITAVTPDDTSLTLDFAVPGSNGGAAVTGYEYSLDAGGSWQPGPFGVVTSPLTVAGLANGTEYSVTLRAVTVAGGGAASAAADGTPRTIALAPTLEAVTAGDHSLVVTFTPPADDGGDAVLGYRYSLDSGTTWSDDVVPTTTSPLTVFGLDNGRTYEVALAAVNRAGDGASSSVLSGVPVSSPATLPGEVAPPALALGIGVATQNGELVPVTSRLTGHGWEVATSSVVVSLEAYDLHAELVAGSGGEAYFQGYRGGYVLVRGEGFKPGSMADVWIFSTPEKLGSLTVASDGTFSGMLRLPTSLSVGSHTIQVNGVTAASETSSTSTGVRMNNAPKGLAVTGASVGWGLAVQMMCAGAALVIVGRRRRAV